MRKYCRLGGGNVRWGGLPCRVAGEEAVAKPHRDWRWSNGTDDFFQFPCEGFHTVGAFGV